MKAMLLAAGIGSRLGQITDRLPKALVQVAGKPMLEHVILNLKSAGVSEIVINLFHLADQIEEYLKTKKNFAIDIHFSHEKKLLGTGGGLRNAGSHFISEKAFFLYNCDIYCDLDLKLLAEYHRQNPALATLVVMRRASSRKLLFKEDGSLMGWKNPDANKLIGGAIENMQEFAFSGIHIISSKLFDFMKEEPDNFSIIKAYMNAAEAGQKVQKFVMPDRCYWADVGKPESLERANKHKFS